MAANEMDEDDEREQQEAVNNVDADDGHRLTWRPLHEGGGTCD
jgi:hypothetical protein